VKYSTAAFCASCSLRELTVTFTGRWIGRQGLLVGSLSIEGLLVGGLGVDGLLVGGLGVRVYW
jgi:hypothetical protein